MNIKLGTKNCETLNISSERNTKYSLGWTAEGCFGYTIDWKIKKKYTNAYKSFKYP